MPEQVEEFSENRLQKDCPHCDPNSFAYKHPIEETPNFRVVCDVHPLCEGHLLIIPKAHLSCVGEYPRVVFEEFMRLYKKYSDAIKQIYGSVASFEHGIAGQTVFHLHVHILPFAGGAEKIVSEGKQRLRKIFDFEELQSIFKQEGRYLFFSIGSRYWVVDVALVQPGFFRDRFAQALGRSERRNWKAMHEDKILMAATDGEIRLFKEKLADNFTSLV